MIEQKIEEAKAIIQQALASALLPIVLWSAGKDSMVLLWLFRQLGVKLPVFFFREPFQEHKFEFANYIIREWALDVRTALPAARYLIGDKTVEVVNLLRTGPDTTFYLPTGINQVEQPRAEWECGLMLLNAPTPEAIQWEWDVAFIGHRSEDVDPVHGAIPLQAPTARLGNTTLVYPLHNWPTADIWEASRRFFIPQNLNRYDPFNDFQELRDYRANPDYMDICVACCYANAPARVHCPKLGQEIGNQVNPAKLADPAAWRLKFVNLEVNNGTA